jgi:hypothetical protein
VRCEHPSLAGDTTDSRATAGFDKALVIEDGGDREVWSLERDRVLDLVPPKAKHGTYELMFVRVVGDVMIAQWNDCAGPCGRSIVVDSSGNNRGRWFNAGRTLRIDAARVAILTEESARSEIVDTTTGRPLGSIPIRVESAPASTSTRS